MALHVAWTESAWRELESAASFIAEDSPRYAAALIEDARHAARSLRRFPNWGRVVPEIGDSTIRELFVKSYRLMDQVSEQRAVILAFIHGARDFKPP